MSAIDYLTNVVSPLLAKPESLNVIETRDEMGVLLTVTVHKEDMGSVIGRAGETAHAIRHMVRAVGARNGARVSVKINEPEGSLYRHN